MPSIKYYNQSAPFWDWVAGMESAANDHPFFNAYAPRTRDAREAERQVPADSSESEGTQPHHHDGPSPHPPPTDGPEGPHSPPPPPGPGSRHGGPPHHRHEGGPPGCGWGRRHGGGHHGGGRRGGHGPGFPFGGPPRFRHGGFGGFGGHDASQGFDLSSIAQFFGQQLGVNVNDDADKEKNEKTDTTGGKDFSPPCDVFDTEDAFIVHISLPGAKKEDVGINWNADISELSVAGVIYRPGDEDFLKTLAMDERQVGVFERKVRLGSRARPAMVEIDEISAKMEDGILVVKVPKLDSEYVDVKKVEIE